MRGRSRSAHLPKDPEASRVEFGVDIKCAVERGWLELHESGTYVRLLKGRD
ncbi:hypothetical protein ABID59_001953 [Bradyrhizobium sp. S3.3.6]